MNELRVELINLTRSEIIDLLCKLADDGELERLCQAIPAYRKGKAKALYDEACAQEAKAKGEMEVAEGNYEAFIGDIADSHPGCRRGDAIDFTLLFSLMTWEEREMEKGFRDTYVKATKKWKLKRVCMNNRRKVWERNR